MGVEYQAFINLQGKRRNNPAQKSLQFELKLLFFPNKTVLDESCVTLQIIKI